MSKKLIGSQTLHYDIVRAAPARVYTCTVQQRQSALSAINSSQQSAIDCTSCTTSPQRTCGHVALALDTGGLILSKTPTGRLHRTISPKLYIWRTQVVGRPPVNLAGADVCVVGLDHLQVRDPQLQPALRNGGNCVNTPVPSAAVALSIERC